MFLKFCFNSMFNQDLLPSSVRRVWETMGDILWTDGDGVLKLKHCLDVY